MLTAAEYFEELMQIPPISSGFPMLDELLEGLKENGFINGKFKDLLHYDIKEKALSISYQKIYPFQNQFQHTHKKLENF